MGNCWGLLDLASAKERARRTQCLNNQRQIGVATVVYAGDNSDKLVPALDLDDEEFQPIALLAAFQCKAWDQSGFTIQSNASTIWTCPNRPTLPAFNPQYDQWGIGYQYYGGVTKWRNQLGVFTSAILALLCFVAYVVFCLGAKYRIESEKDKMQAVCRAGASLLLVAFWFAGGLFKLPTATVFWILLELGAQTRRGMNLFKGS